MDNRPRSHNVRNNSSFMWQSKGIRDMRAIIAAALISAGAVGAASAQELNVKPGNWETTTNMTMSLNMNGQAMNVPPREIKQTQCMTPEDAKFSTDDLVQEGCTVSNVQSGDRSLSFDMTCSQQGANMTGSMSFEIDASGESGTGTMEMAGSMPGGTMSMTGNTTATYLGGC